MKSVIALGGKFNATPYRTILQTLRPSRCALPYVGRRQHVRPGGYLPALSEVLPAIEQSGLLVCDVAILRLHYAETLKSWRERFLARRDEVIRLYGERFYRLWEFYLAASEMTFRKQNI